MNTVLFDLDGTLLPMDQEKFVKRYFGELAKYMLPFGFDPDELVKSVWKCTKTAMNGDGTMSNHDAFWNAYRGVYGEDGMRHKAEFDRFYETDFSNTKASVGFSPLADRSVKLLKSKGYRVVLATNPIFPRTATYARAGWAGLDTDDFELITTYENSGFCKPNVKYFEEILGKIGADAADCLMVGNDVREDMCAAKIGIETLLLTDCVINPDNEDYGEKYRCVDFDGLYNYFENLPDIR